MLFKAEVSSGSAAAPKKVCSSCNTKESQARCDPLHKNGGDEIKTQKEHWNSTDSADSYFVFNQYWSKLAKQSVNRGPKGLQFQVQDSHSNCGLFTGLADLTAFARLHHTCQHCFFCKVTKQCLLRNHLLLLLLKLLLVGQVLQATSST